MPRSAVVADALAERLCRPQRLGVFGHRGVGKTTLLAALYREAVGGRLAELRLAAADARTADYLSDKVLQRESDQALPATLAETDLRFHLYCHDNRLELLVKDYQGEQVELGRDGPIRDFLRDCDAIWLCLDLAILPAPADRLRRQQEIEQLIEDCLVGDVPRPMDRPMALVLTKADLLGAEPADLDELARTYFGMTRHALQVHCVHNGLFAVSSLERKDEERPSDRGLAGPLKWLATALQAQDEARLEQLWELAPKRLGLLERCVRCFIHRYPGAPVAEKYRERLRELRRRRRRRRGLAGMAAIVCLVFGLWSYDALGYQTAADWEAHRADDPAAQLENWQQYQTWHPTRHLLGALPARQEELHLRELAARQRDRERDESLAELRRRAADPDADPETVWRQFQELRGRYPDDPVSADLDKLRAALQARRDEQFRRRAQRAHDELVRAGQRCTDVAGLVVLADRFLRDFAGSPAETDVRRRREVYLRQLDEKDIQAARDYSARQPLHFQTRRELYQRYLDRHPHGGAFTAEAQAALKTTSADWDRHDFRAVRDHYLAKPGHVTELVAYCRRYLAVHPRGRFTASAAELLRWSERVTQPGEYRVVLRGGEFERSVARWLSRGPKLSVRIEVAGVSHGPSTIVLNRYDPEWNYEFPRKVRWKLGDPVRIEVTEHSWKDRVVAEMTSDGNDPLALRMLSGEVASGPNRLTFESDFALPKPPKIE